MAKLTNMIIFSKDRAAQLDLFLNSMKRFYPEWDKSQQIHVLYTFSSESFGAGYSKTIMLHPEIHYVLETPGRFKQDLLNLISTDVGVTIFFVDDDVFKEDFELRCPEMKEFLKRDNIACLSLRLDPDINYCYTMNIPIQKPRFLEDKLIWKWQEASQGDWNYPMSLDGHFFKTEDILPLMNLLEYSNPNLLEGALAASPFNIPYMICFKDSKIVNIPANKVQNVNSNRCGNMSQYEINDKYLVGNRLSLNKLLNKEKFKNNTSCHQDVELEWN